MTAGRPTKLTTSVIAKAKKYLDEIEERTLVVKQGGPDEEGEPKWKQTAPMLPNHARLAIICGVDKGTMYDWEKDQEVDDEVMKGLREEFRHCLSRVKSLQEAMLNENGAAGIYNPAVTNRILAAHHDYRDRIDSDVTSGGQPIAVHLVSFGEDDLINKKDVERPGNSA